MDTTTWFQSLRQDRSLTVLWGNWKREGNSIKPKAGDRRVDAGTLHPKMVLPSAWTLERSRGVQHREMQPQARPLLAVKRVLSHQYWYGLLACSMDTHSARSLSKGKCN